MRKIIILSFISLDGVMQAPGGPDEDKSGGFEYGGWTVPYWDDMSGKIMDEQMTKPFDLLLGRKTYDIFQSYWPNHAENWPQSMTATKYVASHSTANTNWEKTVVLGAEPGSDIVEELKKLKESKGPDLQVHGSGNFIQTLLKNDLVDEFWLKIFPVTLGPGKKLFESGTIPLSWKLESSAIAPSGVIFCNYTRAGEVKTGSF